MIDFGRAKSKRGVGRMDIGELSRAFGTNHISFSRTKEYDIYVFQTPNMRSFGRIAMAPSQLLEDLNVPMVSGDVVKRHEDTVAFCRKKREGTVIKICNEEDYAQRDFMMNKMGGLI